MCRIQQKVSDGLEVLQFFTTRAWDFRCSNFMSLVKGLNAKDEETFYVALYDLEPREYMFKCVLGGRQYCLKEPLSTIPKARRQLKALYVLDRVTKLILLCSFIWMLFEYTSIKNVFYSILGQRATSIKNF